MFLPPTHTHTITPSFLPSSLVILILQAVASRRELSIFEFILMEYFLSLAQVNIILKGDYTLIRTPRIY